MTAAPENISKYRKECQNVLANLTIMDDIFMRNVLKKQVCAEYILQVIMNSPGLQITEPVIQKDFKNLQGRSAILDCVVQGKDGISESDYTWEGTIDRIPGSIRLTSALR